MAEATPSANRLTRGRIIFATVAVVLMVLVVWKIIDYRMQPPPPPHPVGEIQRSDK